MALRPNEEIGMEVHPHTDQFIRIEKGKARVQLKGQKHAAPREYYLNDGGAILIPAGTYHNVINISSHSSLFLYTIYSPPHHSPDTRERYS